MTTLNIEQTDNSPKVIMDHINGLIEFEGKSYPENTIEFYEPILTWLKEYFSEYAVSTTVMNIKFTYFNSATTQILFDILDIVDSGNYVNLEINWYYDASNENGMEDYEDYSEEFPELNIKAVAL